MNRLFRIILISIVIVGLWGTARVQNRMVELETGVKQGLLDHKDRIDDLTKVFDLSVLDSCGIITDGQRWGSCVAIGPSLILTAGHCEWDTEHWIEIKSVRYKIIAEWASEFHDVRFIKVEGIIPFAELGQIPKLLDTVYFVGSPYDPAFATSITKGIVSKLNVTWYNWKKVIQVDAEGAPGSSGCPLFDVNGLVLGICVGGPVPGGGVTLCESVDSIRLALEEYNAFCIGKTKELPLGQRTGSSQEMDKEVWSRDCRQGY